MRSRLPSLALGAVAALTAPTLLLLDRRRLAGKGLGQKAKASPTSRRRR